MAEHVTSPVTSTGNVSRANAVLMPQENIAKLVKVIVQTNNSLKRLPHIVFVIILRIRVLINSRSQGPVTGFHSYSTLLKITFFVQFDQTSLTLMFLPEN